MKKYALGIDLGGTGTKFGLVNEEGKVLRSNSIPTQQYPDIDEYCDVLCAGLKQLVADEGITMADVVGVGCGAPNANFYSGCIEQAPNLPRKGVVPFAKLISERMGVKCTITNDANAAAYGELVYGGARGMKHFIMFTLGTGVGSGVVVDGKLVLGKTGGAGELGHAILIPEGRQCGCGNKGCLETYCSATGIRRTALELMEKSPSYTGALSKVSPDELTSKMVGDAAKYGDPLAIEVFEKTGYLLGIAMANAVTFSGPEAVFLFGGPVKAGDVLLKPLRKSFEEHLCFIFKGSVDVRVSELPDNDAAILGAAALTKA